MSYIRHILSLLIFIAVANIATAINISSDSIWGLVNVSVAHVRTEPRHGAEMSTQALMGTPMKILGNADGWSKVLLPDGYEGYMIDNCIAFKSEQQMAEWRMTSRLIVSSCTEIKAYNDSVAIAPHDIVADMVNGNIVEGKIVNNKKRTCVTMPDGRTAWVDNNSITDFKEWAMQPIDVDLVMETAYSMLGTPYLWGGTSSKGVDCSGLVKVAFFSTGLITMRDASQQSEVGVVTNDYHRGDLLFFWNASKTRVNHVGIYDKDGYYIQSAGRVRRSHLSHTHSDYYPNDLKECRTYQYDINSIGIKQVKSHKWYF